MCGIVGYIGDKAVVPIIIDGLRKLEYRGYDSAGIAVINNGIIEERRSVGKLERLDKLLQSDPLSGTSGIGHTRWATHGKPSNNNAHPHIDCKKRIALVHNGIIENYLKIKESLINEGHVFLSDTDTEVIVHLIEKYYKNSLEEAVTEAVNAIKGSYALAILSSYEPDKIIAVRIESPLVIGVGKGENFIASDIPAFLAHTRDVILLNDEEIAVVTKDSVKLQKNAEVIERKSFRVLWDSMMAEKGGYKHFMLKEIYEQPVSLRNTLKGFINDSKIVLEEAKFLKKIIGGIKKISIVACGTAYYAGMTGKYILEELTRIPVEIDVSSEFRYRNPILSEDTLFIAISQSGETADTLAAVREAGKKGAHLLAITNVVGSSITREVNGAIFTRASLEIGVAATKTFTAQVLVIYLLSCYIAQEKGLLKGKELEKTIQELEKIPSLIEETLKRCNNVKLIARRFHKCRDFLYLGRHINYPIALEGALKLKEISYIHAEGYAAGEMKHGPIALIDNLCPTVAIITKNSVYDKLLSNIKEVAARDGYVIGIATDGDQSVKEYLDHVIYIPETNPLISPLLSIIPLQLLAYYIADCKGRDVDQPRNLAKSVTVE